jgi:hypothetical protein
MSGAQAGAPHELAALGITKSSMANIHWTVRWAQGQRSSSPSVDCYAVRKDRKAEAVKESQSHRTVRCVTGLSGAPQGRQIQRSTPTGDWHGRHRILNNVVSGVPVDRKLLLSVQRPYEGLEPINITPTGHFNVWEPSNISRHIVDISKPSQPLPFIDLSHTQELGDIKASQVPQKRDQAKESYSCEFSDSALWESLRESVCYILWSFEHEVLTPIHLPPNFLETCKASKRHLSVWWSLRGLSDPWD